MTESFLFSPRRKCGGRHSERETPVSSRYTGRARGAASRRVECSILCRYLLSVDPLFIVLVQTLLPGIRRTRRTREPDHNLLSSLCALKYGTFAMCTISHAAHILDLVVNGLSWRSAASWSVVAPSASKHQWSLAFAQSPTTSEGQGQGSDRRLYPKRRQSRDA